MFTKPMPSDLQSDKCSSDLPGTKELVEDLCAVLRQQRQIADPLASMFSAIKDPMPPSTTFGGS